MINRFLIVVFVLSAIIGINNMPLVVLAEDLHDTQMYQRNHDNSGGNDDKKDDVKDVEEDKDENGDSGEDEDEDKESEIKESTNILTKSINKLSGTIDGFRKMFETFAKIWDFKKHINSDSDEDKSFMGKIKVGALRLAFDPIDKYLFSIGGFEDGIVFREYKFSFVGLGLVFAVLLAMAGFVRAIISRDDTWKVAREVLNKFLYFIISTSVFVIFAVAMARATDSIGLHILNTVVGEDKLKKASEEYYESIKKIENKTGKDSDLIIEDKDKISLTDSYKNRKEALERGERISAYAFLKLTFTRALTDKVEDDGFIGWITRLGVTSFATVAITFLVFTALAGFATMRAFLIEGFFVVMPILMAIPIFTSFKTIDPFKAFTKLCLHQIGLILGFAVFYLWMGGNGDYISVGDLFTGIFGVFAVAHLFQHAISTGSSFAGFNLGASLPFTRKLSTMARSNSNHSHDMIKQRDTSQSGAGASHKKEGAKFEGVPTRASGKIISYKAHPLYIREQSRNTKSRLSSDRKIAQVISSPKRTVSGSSTDSKISTKLEVASKLEIDNKNKNTSEITSTNIVRSQSNTNKTASSITNPSSRKQSAIPNNKSSGAKPKESASELKIQGKTERTQKSKIDTEKPKLSVSDTKVQKNTKNSK